MNIFLNVEKNKKRITTMYNRNYGGFDYVRIHSELLKSVPRLKFFAKFVRNCGYTRPLYNIKTNITLN